MPLYDMSIPSLHSPKVGAMVPSACSTASRKNPGCCCFKPSADLVDRLHQRQNVLVGPKPRQKSPAVVGSGNPPCAQRVQVDLVVAAKLQVLQARAAEEKIISDVQHVVRLVVRQMDLEQLQVAIQRLGESDGAGQSDGRPDAPAVQPRERSDYL